MLGSVEASVFVEGNKTAMEAGPSARTTEGQRIAGLVESWLKAKKE